MMRLLVDECTGPSVAAWLRREGHDVVSIYDQHRGLPDSGVLALAQREGRILITNDKDFGDFAYRQEEAHSGVVLLRLTDERTTEKIAVLRRLLNQYSHRLEGQFVVATSSRVRFASSR